MLLWLIHVMWLTEWSPWKKYMGCSCHPSYFHAQAWTTKDCKGPQTNMLKNVGSIIKRPDQQKWKVDILNSASTILQCLSYYVKVNSAIHSTRHRKNSKQSGIVAIESCFALFGAAKEGETASLLTDVTKKVVKRLPKGPHLSQN